MSLVCPNTHSWPSGLWVARRSGRGRSAAGRFDPGKNPARWLGHRDGSQPLLYGLARSERHGQQDDQLCDAGCIPQGRNLAARVPVPDPAKGLSLLVRLLYASRAVDPSDAAIDSILLQSRQFNPTSGITGILCYGGGIFLQAIEGGRNAVNELYGHIVRDSRHTDVVLLHYEEISERRFGGWTMGQVNTNRIMPAFC